MDAKQFDLGKRLELPVVNYVRQNTTPRNVYVTKNSIIYKCHIVICHYFYRNSGVHRTEKQNPRHVPYGNFESRRYVFLLLARILNLFMST